MKDSITFVADAETLAAIERDDFHSPLIAAVMPSGCWVYQWSLEQFRVWCLGLELSDDSNDLGNAPAIL